MIDQLTPKHHVPFILFYSPNPSHPPAAIVACLKLSLSHALSKFYPLAGRLHDPQSPAPTRVEAVTGLFWRAIIRARPGVGAAGEGLATHMVDLRKKMTAAPVAETMLGNFSIPVMLPEEDGSWKNLTLGLRRAVTELDDEKMREARGPRRLEFAVKSQRQMTRLPTRCVFSSWCRFPVYGVDFGWGKPAWVAFGGSIMKHSVVIVDRKGGDGVEAWVSLEQDEMGRLVSDEELLSRVSLC
ncbi:Salutaridinol 7-O-acetyltransferase [Platanthera zijinensis]|uniref:Salutaridinol 7-O-acetyltransferase n=1 Tax=Platanthera zijinensis TaxID=2320716 RepID=A0AAP0B4B8_9ASPA